MAAALTLLITAATLPARAQTPLDIDPTGGLRDGLETSAQAGGMTREELVRKWDTDGNGTIDESEAAVARVRMRRSRLETQQSAAINPLTGRPRGVDAAEESSVEPEAPPELPRKRQTDGPTLPGTRVPDMRPAAPERRSSASAPAANPKPAAPAAAGSTPWRTGAGTGGVRAGAPAARPGYGALKPGSAQAGRPADKSGTGRATTAAAVPDGRGAAFRGGLVPAPRSGRNLQPRGPLPAPIGRPESPTPRTPRLSADEIGGF
ncbi:MAG: hypothetical protein K8S94_06795 [Planctomycetia bacterium]|nr:hypothetical protein [Planctomycetia bacterium]